MLGKGMAGRGSSSPWCELLRLGEMLHGVNRLPFSSKEAAKAVGA